MKIKKVETLAIPEVKVITFERFKDFRGYFTEHFRKSDLEKFEELKDIKEFVQGNESYSNSGALRGFHFQWSPNMGKLFRVISGKVIDCVVDIRKYSPTFGKAIGYYLESSKDNQDVNWIWVPEGFGHLICALEDSIVEYLCTGEFSENQGIISPLAKDIDWSLCDKEVYEKLQSFLSREDLLITDKDKNGMSIFEWDNTEKSWNFVYELNIEEGKI